MLNENTMIEVSNIDSGMVGYTIPELSIRREFSPNEIKKISVKELTALSYIPGGRELLTNYLSVKNNEFLKNIGINMEDVPEYQWNVEDVKNVLLNGSLEELEDALDFAPTGVIEQIKTQAVALKIPDMNKRDAITEKTNLDVNLAINNVIAEEADSNKIEENKEVKTRRVVKKVISSTAD